MVDRLGVHRANEAQVVGNLRRVRQQFTDFDAALPCGLKGKGRSGDRLAGLFGRHGRQTLTAPHTLRKFGTVSAGQTRLGIEQVELRGSSGLLQKDDPFGSCQRLNSLRPDHARFPLTQPMEGRETES